MKKTPSWDAALFDEIAGRDVEFRERGEHLRGPIRHAEARHGVVVLALAWTACRRGDEWVVTHTRYVILPATKAPEKVGREWLLDLRFGVTGTILPRGDTLDPHSVRGLPMEYV